MWTPGKYPAVKSLAWRAQKAGDDGRPQETGVGRAAVWVNGADLGSTLRWKTTLVSLGGGIRLSLRVGGRLA